ncbi:unnamed protein product [Somion occarium]|uniref:Uncharacterized protein n=1 Tax=Somion occarium TaxID=3059160 RepID=A0ABP1CTD4_9APHY
MAADIQTASPFSRLPRLGFNFGPKPSPPSPLRGSPQAQQAQDKEEKADDWYIPYNGPIEAPKPPRAESSQDRESWGDVLGGWLTDDHGRTSQERQGGFSRTRALSSASHLTTSSGNVDPSRKSIAIKSPNVRIPGKPRVTIPSFINLDNAGGIGDVPMPAERSSKYESTIATPHTATTGSNPNRSSLASIWSFGKRGLSHSVSMDQLTKTRSGTTRERANTSAYVPPTTSAMSMSQRGNASNSRPAPVAEDNEYYYSSLLVHQSTPGDPPSDQHDLRSHPYAVAFPSTSAPSQPQSAPPIARDKGKAKLLDPGKLTITWLDPRGQNRVPAYLKPSPRNSILKASLSTPNLRDIPKGKQRWLSAETWCDAIILPRPRFALRLVEGAPSGRIVSPPESPVLSPGETQDSRNKFVKDPAAPPGQTPEQSVSMGNLISTSPPSPPQSREAEPTRRASPASPVEKPPERLKPPRPKSWALDDLALPSPVPSLAQVLAEGEQLDKEREIWRAKATHSFQNKRARSVSRARSKSTSQARRDTESPLEYLAGRTLLGTQAVPPKIHVHAPPVPRSPHTTTSRTAISSVFSTHSQNLSRATSRTRSHAHSNSGHGHTRSQSLSKSAFKLVKSTAALCGFNDKSPLATPSDEKAIAMEGALRGSDTKFIRLQDQVRDENRENERDDVVVITPTSPSAALAIPRGSPADRLNDASPTPSGLSASEGIGIAISSPLPSEDHSHGPIHIPSHPYAQGVSYPYKQPVKVQIPDKPTSSEGEPISATSTATSANRHRQPVLVHPYAQATHPYAAGGFGRAQYVEVPPPPHTDSLYAELTPGHVREFGPDAIRYSPYPPSASSSSNGHGHEPETKQVAEKIILTPQVVTSSDHPYVRNANTRFSELVFGDALVRTMRHSASIDSGFGPSEIEDHNQRIDPADSKTELLQDDESDQRQRGRADTGVTYNNSSDSPNVFHATSGTSSNAVASSGSENAHPPVFIRRTASNATGLSATTHASNSAGSSPGMVSHESSPPLSPRPLNDSDDLERFRDLFYKPTVNADRQSIASSEQRRPSVGSRKTSGSITFEVSSQRSRSISGLTNLARQISEDLEELREEGAESRRDQDNSSPMWGSRFGSVRGSRPDDMSDDPRSLLSQRTSSSDSPAGTQLPLRLPIDVSYPNPTANFPEDIEPEEIESSRASSVFEGASLIDEPSDNFRFGEVGAVSTPPAVPNPHRFSTRLSLIVDDEEHDRHLGSDLASARIPSSQFNLSPLTPDAARSSYMTSDTGSRMSGLSDFPAPPTLTSHMSIGTPYMPHQEDTTLTSIGESQNTTRPPPLLREESNDTFGIRLRRDNFGEAL